MQYHMQYPTKRIKYKEDQTSHRSSMGLKERNNNIPPGIISHRNSFKRINNSNSHLKIKQIKKAEQDMDYKQHYVIGKGGFGRVWKVEARRTGVVYAMKEMSKALVITKKSVPSVMNERRLLSHLCHPFIVNIVCSFQTRTTLYLVMDYLPCGDLRHLLCCRHKFREEEAKFLIGCILVGLQYVHENGIIHRDLKPQNIVLDAQGYARLTDFGVARQMRPNNAHDTSGTPGYMAPQVLCRQNHSYCADYFAIGVMCYELMLRKRPYEGTNRKEIRDSTMARQAYVKKEQIPEDWSLEAADFINRLLQRKVNARLGAKGFSEIVNHPWLRNYPLNKLSQKELIAPHGSKGVEYGCKERDVSEGEEIREIVSQNELILRSEDVQSKIYVQCRIVLRV